MGTSSNFGNMFSVTVAAAFLPFLPMLPFQILLNNLLYDTSQMTIPTDRVDEEQLARPSHWDIGFIRRFMIRFGPISSVFDFATFAVMLWVFDATAPEFRSGWFVESLATQTLIVFVIRTRRVPFFRSRPSRPLLASVLAVVTIGVLIPQSPLNDTLGFAPLPSGFFAVLIAFVITYLAAVEVAKYFFYKTAAPTTARPLQRGHTHRVHRLSARWSHHRPLPPGSGRRDPSVTLRSGIVGDRVTRNDTPHHR
jgi:Mg2+-importing ATPase